jgi:hypothetical protein
MRLIRELLKLRINLQLFLENKAFKCFFLDIYLFYVLSKGKKDFCAFLSLLFSFQEDVYRCLLLPEFQSGSSGFTVFWDDNSGFSGNVNRKRYLIPE